MRERGREKKRESKSGARHGNRDMYTDTGLKRTDFRLGESGNTLTRAGREVRRVGRSFCERADGRFGGRFWRCAAAQLFLLSEGNVKQ